MHIHKYMHVCEYIYVCAYACVLMCVFVCVCMCVYVCVYYWCVCVYMRTHTHSINVIVSHTLSIHTVFLEREIQDTFALLQRVRARVQIHRADTCRYTVVDNCCVSVCVCVHDAFELLACVQ
jgi:hypothetical protein